MEDTRSLFPASLDNGELDRLLSKRLIHRARVVDSEGLGKEEEVYVRGVTFHANGNGYSERELFYYREDDEEWKLISGNPAKVEVRIY